MKNQQRYFKNIDCNICKPLQLHIEEAKADGLKEVALIAAIPDNDNPDYIWCTHACEVIERDICKKSECSFYESKSGRGACQHRGNFYLFGEEVKFNVESGEQVVKDDYYKKNSITSVSGVGIMKP